jgi:hypothetical protein
MAKARHEKSPEIVAPTAGPFVAGWFPIDRLITFYDFVAIDRRQRMRSAARRSDRRCGCRNDQ